jgi:hypothetical protein
MFAEYIFLLLPYVALGTGGMLALLVLLLVLLRIKIFFLKKQQRSKNTDNKKTRIAFFHPKWYYS